MPSVSFSGAFCSGHGVFPPRPTTSGSGNVLINGKPCLRDGDSAAPHCSPKPECHAGSVASSRAKVLVNGKPVACIGDDIDCGSAVAEGSGNVFAGG
mgnify:CR=1 FL=1